MNLKNTFRLVTGFLGVIVFFVVHGVVQYMNQQSVDYLSPVEKQQKDWRLLQVSPDEIEYILIESTGHRPLLDTTKRVTDRAVITNITEAMRTASKLTVNHPSTIWECSLTFGFPSETQSFRITNTSNQGLILRAYTTWRCDALKSILEDYSAKKETL